MNFNYYKGKFAPSGLGYHYFWLIVWVAIFGFLYYFSISSGILYFYIPLHLCHLLLCMLASDFKWARIAISKGLIFPALFFILYISFVGFTLENLKNNILLMSLATVLFYGFCYAIFELYQLKHHDEAEKL